MRKFRIVKSERQCGRRFYLCVDGKAWGDGKIRFNKRSEARKMIRILRGQTK